MAALATQIVGELNRLWLTKQWEFATPEEDDLAFNQFSEMLANVDPLEQRLVLDLTRSYMVFSYNSYPALAIAAVNQIGAVHIGAANKVYVVPLLGSADEKLHRSKSGHHLLYPTEHIALKKNALLVGIPAAGLASVDALSATPRAEERLIIFVDDFIGSADTAINAIDHFEKTSRRSQDHVVVLTLVAMQHALDRLHALGIAAISARVVHKGIEQNPAIVDKASAYAIVDGITRKLEFPQDCLRGYKRSEALVTMIRTPDNTFPMYWTPRRRDGSVWPAPFRRDW